MNPMTQADSVLSTPPTNTSRSRRTVLAGIASAAALPIAAAVPTTGLANPPNGFHKVIDPDGRLWFAADEPDPAFAVIAAMRAAHAAHGEACDVLAEAEERYGFHSAEAEDVYERQGAACDASCAAACSLAITPPTTLAGIVAVLRFANQFEDEGMEWPNSDTIGPDGWHYQLRATMAQAIEAIIHQAAGGLA
jgi:hypothetical protein